MRALRCPALARFYLLAGLAGLGLLWLLLIGGAAAARPGVPGGALAARAPRPAASPAGAVTPIPVPARVVTAPVGLGLAADGSFWIGDAGTTAGPYTAAPDAAPRLVHLAADGRLLAAYPLTAALQRLTTIKVWRNTIWAVGTDHWPDEPQLVGVSAAGRILSRQRLPWQAAKYGLPVLLGGDGALLLAQPSGYQRPPFVEVLDAQGRVTGAELAGLERGGRLYIADLAAPPGRRPTTGTIHLGPIAVPLTVTGGVFLYLQLVHVRADGGCYVLVGEERENPPGAVDTRLLWLAADGTRRGETRLPGEREFGAALGRLAVAPDDTAAALVPAPVGPAVQRLVFAPRLDPLPTVVLPAPTLTPTLTPIPTFVPPPLAGATVVLALPSGDAGLRAPVGLAVTADGSLWIGDQIGLKIGETQFRHYTAAGTPLPVASPQITGDRDPGALRAFALAGADRWVVDAPYYWAPRLLRIEPSGAVPVHEGLPADLGPGLIGLLVAPGGEVLARLSTGGVGEDGFAPDWTLLVDAAGRYAPRPSAGVPYRGGIVRLTLAAHPDQAPRSGTLTIGPHRIPLAAPAGGTFVNGAVLAVDAAGTTTILLGVRPAGGGAPGALVQRWSTAGRLLGQAALPLAGPPAQVILQVAVGPDGAIYGLAPQGAWWLVARFPLTTRPSGAPPTPALAPLTTATPLPTPIADLATLARAADLIALVTNRYSDSAGGQTSHSYAVLRWFKKPPGMPRFHGGGGPVRLSLSTYREGPPAAVGRGILFLQWCPPGGRTLWNPRVACQAVGAMSGVFALDAADRLVGAGISRYRGWTLEQFSRELRAVLAAQPPPGPVPTPAPTATEARP
jgi:hypothetical protein